MMSFISVKYNTLDIIREKPMGITNYLSLLICCMVYIFKQVYYLCCICAQNKYHYIIT